MIATFITENAVKLSWDDVSEILTYFNTVLIPTFQSSKFNTNDSQNSRFYQLVDKVEDAADMCFM
jgi:hypothetical protein